MSARITILSSDQGTPAFVLADNFASLRGPGSKVWQRGAPAFDAAVQTARYTEGDEPENFDRQNETTDWTVEVAYEFATLGDAYAFAAQLQKKVPRVANVKFELSGNTFYLANARLRPMTPVEDLGVTLIYRFNISGGLLLTKLPTTT